MSPGLTREVVVIGGGIIGCTTAYYLTRHPSAPSARITLIEASKHGPAQGASGKAGGLVARWAYPEELVDVSFDEHVRLAEEHNGKERWGWRFVNCGSWEGRGEVTQQEEEGLGVVGNKDLEKAMGLPGGKKPTCRSQESKNSLPSDLTWVKNELTDAYTPMAQDGATAQVHPYLFTTSMFELARERGLTYINGQATKVVHANGQVTGVQFIDPETKKTKSLSATHVIVAAGVWSPFILKHLPISAIRAHSITVRPREGVTIAPYALFTKINDPASGGVSSPEIYARPDNEVYACGQGDDCILPETVDDVVVDQASCDLIYKYISSISTEFREGKVERRQACFLPIVSAENTSGPIIEEAGSIARGLYIGTGHTCWVSLYEELKL